MKINDHVTINAPHSVFNKQTGVITEIVEDSVFPYTVQFDNTEDGICYFAEDELSHG